MFRDPASLPDPFPQTLRPLAWARPSGSLSLLRPERGLEPLLSGTEFVLSAPYRVAFRQIGEVGTREIVVPEGFVTDLASVPRLLRPWVGQIGLHLEAAVVHDYLYVQRWREGGDRVARRAFADRMMLAMMAHADYGLRWPVYFALRLLGGLAMGAKPLETILDPIPQAIRQT